MRTERVIGSALAMALALTTACVPAAKTEAAKKADIIMILINDELQAKLVSLKEELFNLSFRHATGQLENPCVLKQVKKDIARVKTVIREREIKADA